MRRGRIKVGGMLLAVAAVVLASLAASGALATGASGGSGRASAKGKSDCHKKAPPILHDGFPEPPTRYSRNGRLDVPLTASLGTVLIDGKRVKTLNYDGTFPGPTLVICA
ncbi:MAG TPA: hypothetical protein VGI52_06135, partial [Solirubrobacteraceae bacterium]